MAKVVYIGIVDHASGKICQHSDTSFAYRKKSGTSYTVRRDMQREYRPTSGQLLQQEAFKQQRAAVSTFVKKVKAIPKNEDKLVAMYNADNKAKSLHGFVWRHFDFEENTITVGGVTYNSEMTEAIQG